jgi:hypothetical protein
MFAEEHVSKSLYLFTVDYDDSWGIYKFQAHHMMTAEVYTNFLSNNSFFISKRGTW